MNSFVLAAYASLTALGSVLQWLLDCPNFRFRRFILLVQMAAAAQAAENHGDGWGIYTPIAAWNHSQNLLAAAEALSLKIPSHGTNHKWLWRSSKTAWE